MAGETPAPDAAPAADAAAPDLLEVAASAEADKPAAEAAAPAQTPADKPADGSKPEAKAAGDDGKGEGDKPDADLLADNDEGNSDEKADGKTDADKRGAPETYEAFTLPDGVALDEAALTKVTPVFRDLNLTQEQAQKLVSFYAQQQQEASQAQLAGFNKVKSDWQSAIKADAEFGGDQLPKTLGAAKAMLTKFGDADLRNDLKEWGWANHPGLIKLLARVSAHFSEDTLVHAAAATPARPKSAAEVLWPSMYQTKE